MNYRPLSDWHLGFIGAGNIALSLANGFIKSGAISVRQVSASAPSLRNLSKFKSLGCFTTNDNNLLFSGQSEKKCPKVIFLCVKPIVFNQSFDEKKPLLDLTAILKSSESNGPLIVVSVMAGITIDRIRSSLIDNSIEFNDRLIRFVRLMPNTATTICYGICGISTDTKSELDFDDQYRQFLTTLLGTVGLCEFVAEHHMNAITGLGGSGIAFIYSLIHAMSDGGLKMGLPRSVSTNIAAQTVLGASQMVLQTGMNPIVLRDEVTSPGGTTIHGLHALERGGFNAIIMDAIESATKRADQLN